MTAVALDLRVRAGKSSSFVRTSLAHEAALEAAGVPWTGWDGGAVPAPVLWHPVAELDRAVEGVARVPTLHDVSPLLPDPRPAPVRWRRARRFRRRLARLARDGTAFAAVSEDVRRRVLELHPELDGRIVVVPHHPAPAMRPLTASERAAALERLGLGEGFVLFVSALRRHKNWEGALAAFAALPEPLRRRHPLILVGDRRRAGRRPERLAARLGLDPGQVRFLGAVGDDLLPALYGAAAVLIHPSFGEGFGLPVLEAMACGAPVVVSANTALPEVAGEAGSYGDPWAPRSFTPALRRHLEDEGFRAERAAASLRRAAEFTAERSGRAARELLAVARAAAERTA